MKLKVSELEGKLLNLAVAHCVERSKKFPMFFDGEPMSKGDYITDWALAGPIIEREKMRIAHNFDEHIWEAGWDCHVSGWGDTPLIAAMRCYVASKLGDEIQLLKNEEVVQT